MDDREKVIMALECCLSGDNVDACGSCPYIDECVHAVGKSSSPLRRDAIILLKAQEPGWISVRDRLPEESGRYLVYAKEGERETHRTIAPFQKAFHLSGRMAYWRVTHWMPLPEPPKEGT